MTLLRRAFPQTNASDALPDAALEDLKDEIEVYSRFLISALTVCLPGGTTKRAEAKSNSRHLPISSAQPTVESNSTSLEPMYSLPTHKLSSMSRSSISTTEIWCALRCQGVRYMIGAGSPNRPNHWGRNVLMCQSSMIISGISHCVSVCARVASGGVELGQPASSENTTAVVIVISSVNVKQRNLLTQYHN